MKASGVEEPPICLIFPIRVLEQQMLDSVGPLLLSEKQVHAWRAVNQFHVLRRHTVFIQAWVLSGLFHKSSTPMSSPSLHLHTKDTT